MHSMSDKITRVAGFAQRRRAIGVLAIAGGIAIAASQWHVLPPMVCFGVLMAGLIALGAVTLAALPRRPRAARRAVPHTTTTAGATLRHAGN